MRFQIALLMALSLCTAATPETPVAASQAPSAKPQSFIYDDGCSFDVDCVAKLPILCALQDRHEISILAMVADSATLLTAPVFKIFATFAGYPKTVIGANKRAFHRCLHRQKMQLEQMGTGPSGAF